MAEEDKLAHHYEQAQRYFYDELNLLFQRFNFFLVLTTFLVAGFVGSVVWPGAVVLLTHSLAALATFLSYAFFLINYLNAKIVKVRSDYFSEVPRRRDEYEAMSRFDMHRRLVKNLEDNNQPVKLLSELPRDLRNMIKDPLELSKSQVAYHTWMIPLVFFAFWVAAWWIVTSWILPVIFLIVLPLSTVLYVFVIPWLRSWRNKSQSKGNSLSHL